MGKRKEELTQEEVLAWADSITGVPAHESAKKLGVNRNTITKWRKRVRNWIEEGGFDINNYRLPIYGLYPLWLQSAIRLLKKGDSAFTTSFAKGMGLFVEKTQTDGNLNLSNLSNDELVGLVRECLGVEGTAEGSSRADNPGT